MNKCRKLISLILQSAQQGLEKLDEIFSKWSYSINSQFNGAEDDIVVYVTKSDNLYLPAITRARKLLVVITYGEKWREENRKNPYYLPIMEEAVAKNLVTKFPQPKTISSENQE